MNAKKLVTDDDGRIVATVNADADGVSVEAFGGVLSLTPSEAEDLADALTKMAWLSVRMKIDAQPNTED